MVLLLPFIACLWPIAAALVVRQSITELGAAEVAAFTPYSNFAAAAYCPPNKTATWSCGGTFFTVRRLRVRRLTRV